MSLAGDRKDGLSVIEMVSAWLARHRLQTHCGFLGVVEEARRNGSVKARLLIVVDVGIVSGCDVAQWLMIFNARSVRESRLESAIC